MQSCRRSVWGWGNKDGIAQTGIKRKMQVSDSILFVSFSGDIQDPPGRGLVQPAVGDPASTGGLD